MVEAVLHAAPVVFSVIILLLGLAGFWRGLSVRPHEPGHAPPPLSKYFWWAND